MDYTKLEKEGITQAEIFEFFQVKNEKEMEKLIGENLDNIKIKLNDELGYISPELIYDYAVVENHNIFYEKLMTISFFLRAFAGYKTILMKSFAEAIGVIKFVYIAEQKLNLFPEYIFFVDAYKEFKQDKYFREQTDRMLSIFEEISKDIENMDLEEIKNITEEFKELKE